jgi:ribosome-associated translation inhibitor RaiA
MRHGDSSHRLPVEIDEGIYRITADEAAKMEQDLGTLRKVVEAFPVSELKVEITVLNPSRVRAATTLRLPSQTLYAADDDRELHPAWDRCVRRLVDQVIEYKERLGNKPTYTKEIEGTIHDVVPLQAPDTDAVEAAIRDGQYARFRQAMAVYEEALEARVGRRVQRYPEAEAQLGDGLVLSEIVEDVFLNAFEQYARRPPLRLGQWLESLIDPSIEALLTNTDEEKENLSFIETAKAVERAERGPR